MEEKWNDKLEIEADIRDEISDAELDGWYEDWRRRQVFADLIDV